MKEGVSVFKVWALSFASRWLPVFTELSKVDGGSFPSFDQEKDVPLSPLL